MYYLSLQLFYWVFELFRLSDTYCFSLQQWSSIVWSDLLGQPDMINVHWNSLLWCRSTREVCFINNSQCLVNTTNEELWQIVKYMLQVAYCFTCSITSTSNVLYFARTFEMLMCPNSKCVRVAKVAKRLRSFTFDHKIKTTDIERATPRTIRTRFPNSYKAANCTGQLILRLNKR